MSEPCACREGCDCGCCAGIEPVTPEAVANRPGLDALAYRVGTWSSFLETMEARLSSAGYPALAGLRTRDASDPAIALLDAWAVVADVLTFYQERIANEGYLRTATERRSVLELARLVGYTPRPGVAASVYLAYTLEQQTQPAVAPGSPAAPVSASVEEPATLIPAGARAQSVPGPGEQPQPFETGADLAARAAWNDLGVRLTRPQQPDGLIQVSEEPFTLGIQVVLSPGATAPSAAAGPAATASPAVVALPAAVPAVVAAVAPVPAATVPAGTIVPPAGGSPSLTTTVFLDDSANAVTVTGPLANGSFTLELPAAGETVTVEVSGAQAVAEIPVHLTFTFAVRGWVIDLDVDSRRRLAVASRGLDLAGVTARLVALDQGGEVVTVAAARRAAIYLQGIATQLKANDPLLATTGAGAAPELYRVTAVQPDAQQARTRAEVELWFAPPPVLPPVAAAALPVSLSAAVAAFVERSTDLQAHGVSPGATAQRVLSLLASMRTAAAAGAGDPALRQGIAETLVGLRAERQGAEKAGGSRLVPWIGRLVADLETVSATASLAPAAGPAASPPRDTTQLSAVLTALGKPPQPQPRNGLQLQRSVAQLFAPDSDLAARLLAVVRPELGDVVYTAWANVPVTPAPDLEVLALRTRASVFGGNAPQQLVRTESGAITGTVEWQPPLTAEPAAEAAPAKPAAEVANVVWLDGSYPQILPGSWIVLERPQPLARGIDPSPLVIARVAAVSQRSRAEYGISAKSTRIELDRDWLAAEDHFDVIRGTTIYAESVSLPLAEVPIDPVTEPVCGKEIELAGLYDGLAPGRWLIVAGERTDVGEIDDQGNIAVPVAGVPAAELAMLAGVTQGVAAVQDEGEAAGLPGDRTHTTLLLATPLAHCYKRDTVTVYGNVADATHGETKAELLGSGDGSQVWQRFTLRQPPLTWVSAPTPSGVASTLAVRVNDLLWHEAESLAALGPSDRGYLTSTDDSGATTVVFGDGKHGARLPTGSANVRATYRSRIGAPGNVKAGQISQLATRPLGVKGVVNPLPATGGADPESRDQARRNAPLAVMALDRLVSVQDYADFARTFGGIGKASAARLSNGRVQLVHVTIAGVDDVPILESSDLFQNLAAALQQFGDPRQPIQLAACGRRLLVMSAEVEVLPDYTFETVAPQVRAAMLGAFGYERRDLGQDAVLSEAYRTIQGVAGVALADVRLFDAVSGSIDPGDLRAQLAELTGRQPRQRVRACPARVDRHGVIQPGRLVYLAAEVPDTLILEERTS